jgi:hypothetical protein
VKKKVVGTIQIPLPVLLIIVLGIHNIVTVIKKDVLIIPIPVLVYPLIVNGILGDTVPNKIVGIIKIQDHVALQQTA